MTLKKIPYLILTLLALVACNTKTKPLQDATVKNGISSFKNEAQYENVIKQIDGNQSLIQIRSLLYSNDEGKTQSVFGLIDKNGEILFYLRKTMDSTSSVGKTARRSVHACPSGLSNRFIGTEVAAIQRIRRASFDRYLY